MGKSIKISEQQLRVITNVFVMSEGERLNDLMSVYDKFQTDMENLYNIRSHSKEIFEFLDDIRLSGIVNMYQSSGMLWSGSSWIKKWSEINVPYIVEPDEDDEDTENTDAYLRVIEDADRIKNYLINIAIERDSDYDNINRVIRNLSQEIVVLWMKHFGTSRGRVMSEDIENLNEDFVCGNCGHQWVVDEIDTQSSLCHMCGFDQQTKDFNIGKVSEFWVNKKGDK